MRKNATLQAGICLCFALWTCNVLNGQTAIQLFSVSPPTEEFSRSQSLKELGLTDAAFLKLNIDGTQLTEDAREEMRVMLPQMNGEQIVATVREKDIYTPSFRIVDETGTDYTHLTQNIKHYYGKIEGDSGMVAFSVSDESFAGVYVHRGQQYNIELLSDPGRRGPVEYVLYRLTDVDHLPLFECATSDEVIERLPHVKKEDRRQSVKRSSGSVDIYLECDYQTYLHKGSSVSGVTNYITGLFNVVAGIFADAGGPNEGPQLTLSEIKIWTSQDPFNVNLADNSIDVLNAFQCESASYHGRIAHLVSTSGSGLGGIAVLPSCSGSGSAIHGFSNISTSYSSNLNIYSWSVNVLAHELGHNMSSPHTHACSWSGGQIDDCGNVYLHENEGTPGSCFQPSNPVIPVDGTIMSYCHLSSGNGIDLSLGFHPQVAEKINNFAACISEDVVCPTPSIDQLHASGGGGNSMTLQCDLVDGISAYFWEYRQGNGAWQSLGVTYTNEKVVEELQTGIQYEFMVTLYCGGWGASSCARGFSLSSGDCPNDIYLTQNPIPSGSYAASQTILASGQVMTNSSVNLIAGNTVNLQPGFSIGHQGTLSIVIDPGGCQ